MKYFLVSLLFFTSTVFAVDVKISQLPLGAASTTGINDSYPFVSSSVNVTKRMTVWDIVNIPTLVATYAPKASPIFTGTVTAPTFVGALTGNASTASALAANPTDCGSNTYATAIAANGNLTCAAISNAATTGVSTNTPSTLVLRDGSGNFSAGTITATLTGSATSAATATSATTATNIAGGAGGSIPYQTASGATSLLANGSSGQFLKSNGTTLAPSWTTVSNIRSQVTVQGSTGWGSTNTKIKRFTTVIINTGTDITYATSATLGDTFTINTAGIYSISLNDGYSAGASQNGASVNSNQLTTNISGITGANRIAYGQGASTAFDGSASYTGIFAAADIVRCHGDGVGNSGQASFTITKISN